MSGPSAAGRSPFRAAAVAAVIGAAIRALDVTPQEVIVGVATYLGRWTAERGLPIEPVLAMVRDLHDDAAKQRRARML